MNNLQLINKKYHILQRNKLINTNNKFIYNELGSRINLSIENINFSVKNCLEIGYSSNITKNYLESRFKNIKYLAIDISKKICEGKSNSLNLINMDHDSWVLNKLNFDLIISNFYIHITNNFDFLLKNIHQSLKNNGFFITSLPAINCFTQLKQSMFMADIEFYGGAYRRFMEPFSIEYITKILKKYNYQFPVIEIDSIDLKYKNFTSLLNEIRYLGNSNSYLDRKKKFENKKYFKKVEEIYWQKFSQDSSLVLKLETINITGWKQN